VAHHRSRAGLWRFSRVLAVFGLVCVTSALDCGDDPPPCRANCDIEDACGLRSFEDCEAAACDPTGAPIHRGLDACLGAATDCLEAAACACDDGCSKIDRCAGSPDPECVSRCDALVEQDGEGTYRENVCRIDASCEDLAACSSVSG
jgi:hypothetical protein